jgi:hypothetical protein
LGVGREKGKTRERERERARAKDIKLEKEKQKESDRTLVEVALMAGYRHPPEMKHNRMQPKRNTNKI